MLIVELCFLLGLLVGGLFFGKKSHAQLQDQIVNAEPPKSLVISPIEELAIDEVGIYRDARLLNEYKAIMLSTRNDKFNLLEDWSVKVLKGTRFVPEKK